MSVTIHSGNHTAWAGQATPKGRAPGSQRRLGLALMAASAVFMAYALWTVGGLIGRLFAL